MAFIKERVEPRGIILQDVLLRDVRLPETFSVSIQMKLRTEQEALQKEFELQKAHDYSNPSASPRTNAVTLSLMPRCSSLG